MAIARPYFTHKSYIHTGLFTTSPDLIESQRFSSVNNTWRQDLKYLLNEIPAVQQTRNNINLSVDIRFL